MEAEWHTFKRGGAATRKRGREWEREGREGTERHPGAREREREEDKEGWAERRPLRKRRRERLARAGRGAKEHGPEGVRTSGLPGAKNIPLNIKYKNPQNRCLKL